MRYSELIENTDDDDDLFATPKIAFNDVFNEYDEDELMAQGFQYGDHPKQDIEILNNYLEDYKDFRVVGISGGEHDLILHLDRSSRLRETDDDELFGESVNKKIAKWLHNYAVRMQQEPNHWSAFSADEGDEYQNDIAEIREQGKVLQSIAQTFATEGLREGLRVFGYRAHEYDNWWWDRIAPELNDETGISLEDLVDEINIGESENTDHDDDDLFGTTSFNADQAGKLIATANITSGELVDPESIQHALEHAANKVMNSPVVQKKAADQLQKWMAMNNDAQWELVDDIANVVYDINGDGWEPEEDPYYDRANESQDDDELFGVSRSNAVKIGHLLAAAGVTGFDLWEPDTVEDGLKLAKKLPGQGRSADELLQLWKQLDDDDDQWNEYQIIRKIVIDINGDGLLDPEEDPDYDRANEDGHAL